MNRSGPIANRALRDALENVGVHEVGGNNRGQYVETYLRSVGAHPGDPWCAAFVSYRLQQSAKELGKHLPEGFPISAWTPDYATWAKEHDLWIPSSGFKWVQPGDLVCFYFKVLGRIGHIGIIESVAGTDIFTVEGNTGSEDHVNREGDGVYQRIRHPSDLGMAGGFVRLPW